MSTEPSPNYHSNVRRELEPFLPERRGLRVLELGCGEGGTGGWLKDTGRASSVVGVELFPSAASIAATRLDLVHQANLDSFELPGDETFDLILAPDVIEHLVDPAAVLRRLMPRLERGGWLVTSTPNIRHWRIVSDLVFRARWDYGSSGILDPTHLRFFTKTSIRRLHEELGLHVESFGHLELSGRRALLDQLTGGRLRDFLCGQHVVRSRKS